jgi:hypothetical protein
MRTKYLTARSRQRLFEIVNRKNPLNFSDSILFRININLRIRKFTKPRQSKLGYVLQRAKSVFFIRFIIIFSLQSLILLVFDMYEM